MADRPERGFTNGKTLAQLHVLNRKISCLEVLEKVGEIKGRGAFFTVNQKLIYDIGLHKGEDADYYLKLGFDVVAIEASHSLVEYCETRFKDAIQTGRLHLVEGAIAPATAGQKIIFFENTDISEWGTIDPDWASRNKMRGHPSTRVEVSRIDIADVYRTFGVPFYLKVDVEGADRLALQELQALSDRPQYISIESETVDFEELLGELQLLASLGYQKFKPVEQARIPGSTIETTALDGSRIIHTFEPCASGAFGEDIPQPWLTLEETVSEYQKIFRRYRYFGNYSRIQKMPAPVQTATHAIYKIATGYRGALPGWFDTHASL